MMSNVTSLPHVPATVATRKDDRHFHIVVAGEFNAGKSSLVNLLLRQPVLPVTVGYSRMPPLRIFPAENEVYNIVTATNEKIEKQDFLRGVSHDVAIRSARIELPLDRFAGAVISEVSVGQHGELEPEEQDILATADLLVWCTMGQRAWCLTEITIVEKLPRQLLDTAILAVTRSDYLRTDGDREKVKVRLEREAAQYFNRIVMVDASPQAARRAQDDDNWRDSGGQQLFDAVHSIFSKSGFYGKAAPTADLREIEEFRAAKAVESARIADIARGFTFVWQAEIDALTKWIEMCDGVLPADMLTRVSGMLSTFSKTAADPRSGHSCAPAVTACIARAQAALDAICAKSAGDAAAAKAAALVVQLLDEVAQIETRK